MKKLLGLSLIAIGFSACSLFGGGSSLNPTTVNEQANAGSELMKRCQASVAKISAQCGGTTATDCQANVQEVKSECSGAQGIFDTLAQVTADSNK